MLLIREFRNRDFDGVVRCHQACFAQRGHSRWGLARLVRFHGNTTFVAEFNGEVVGVALGITAHGLMTGEVKCQAWLTGLSVLPKRELLFAGCYLRLLKALGERLLVLGFHEAYATTNRKNMQYIAERVGAELIATEPDYYFDGAERSIYRITPRVMPHVYELLDP